MPKRGISQEGLKIIACATMLLDHIGATVIFAFIQQASGTSKGILLDVYELMRIIGRLSFPIYCFLLVEGTYHTRNPKRYGLRLLIAAVVAELPYDLAFYSDVNWRHQNVMVTLLLGFLMLEVMQRCPKLLQKLLAVVPFAVLASLLKSDYRAQGILTIALFALTRGSSIERLLQFFGLWYFFSPGHLMMLNWLGGICVTTQEFAVLAILPISLYGGHKVSKSRGLQWAFYLFYPVHLLVLYWIGRL